MGAKPINLGLRSAIAVIALFASSAFAEDVYLDGPAIEALLSDTSVVSDDPSDPWSQSFSPSGATLYITGDGEESPGSWGVQGDEYCSLWPPSGRWDCYRVRAEDVDDKTRIIWVSPHGFESSAFVVEKP